MVAHTVKDGKKMYFDTEHEEWRELGVNETDKLAAALFCEIVDLSYTLEKLAGAEDEKTSETILHSFRSDARAAARLAWTAADEWEKIGRQKKKEKGKVREIRAAQKQAFGGNVAP